jgi:hypothetical protein
MEAGKLFDQLTKSPNHQSTDRLVAVAPRRWHSTCFRVGIGMFLWLELHALRQDGRALEKRGDEATCQAIVDCSQPQSWYFD